MRLYLDNCSDRAIQLAESYGLGLTTNPVIILRDRPGENIRDVLKRLNMSRVREVFFQLETFDNSLLDLLNPERFVIKIPWVRDKYEIALAFKQAGYRVCATAVYSIEQLLLATSIDVDYIAFYYDRCLKKGLIAHQLLARFIELLRKVETRTKIVVASLKSMEQVVEAIECGATILTIPVELFEVLLNAGGLAESDAEQFASAYWQLVRNCRG